MIESAKSIAARVRAGEISPVELVETALASIEEHNGELNAFVSLREEEALAEAREMADQIAAGGDRGHWRDCPSGSRTSRTLKAWSPHLAVGYMRTIRLPKRTARRSLHCVAPVRSF